MSPAIHVEVLRSYLVDLQLSLLLAAIAWTAAIWRRPGCGHVVLVVAANLMVNIVFFMTYPLFTPYYTVPIAMLSLWTLLFVSLIPREAVADNPAVAQPASA